MTRRTFLLTPLALAAQARLPQVRIIWADSHIVPAEYVREGIVFTRAYTACPDAARARKALETGRFPHAARPDDAGLPTGGDAGTITVLTTASGDGEESPLERSLKVPLAIRWPGKLAPRLVDEFLISHVDVFPTLLALAGIPAPEGLQGRDLSALLLGRQSEVPDSIYSEGKLGQADEWRAVVRGFDKVVINPQEEVIGLYNLTDDPNEDTNLAHSRDHELLQDSMLALARRWMRTLADGRDPSGLRLRN